MRKLSIRDRSNYMAINLNTDDKIFSFHNIVIVLFKMFLLNDNFIYKGSSEGQWMILLLKDSIVIITYFVTLNIIIAFVLKHCFVPQYIAFKCESHLKSIAPNGLSLKPSLSWYFGMKRVLYSKTCCSNHIFTTPVIVLIIIPTQAINCK